MEHILPSCSHAARRRLDSLPLRFSPDIRAERPLHVRQLLVAGIADDVEGAGGLPAPDDSPDSAAVAVTVSAGHAAVFQGGRARRDRLRDELPGDVVDDIP